MAEKTYSLKLKGVTADGVEAGVVLTFSKKPTREQALGMKRNWREKVRNLNSIELLKSVLKGEA
uniref:Uncharacterized protein n=1 Tax=uncultured Spirochaetaceae bacterium TaxID=201186 RepID=A0A650ENL4_9SPIO|nr:hypothetical protein Unknown280_0420 [uncultured Spirochaetaceae bacterium]